MGQEGGHIKGTGGLRGNQTTTQALKGTDPSPSLNLGGQSPSFPIQRMMVVHIVSVAYGNPFCVTNNRMSSFLEKWMNLSFGLHNLLRK